MTAPRPVALVAAASFAVRAVGWLGAALLVSLRAVGSLGAAVAAARRVAWLVAALLAAAPVGAQVPWDKLKVCADPSNLPFSNRAREGFENRLAEIWARELGIELEYTWFPQRRGFERNTLTAEDPNGDGYKCNVIVGVPDGYDLAMTTQPYYRSTYALVYVAERGLDIDSGADLIDLPRATRDALRIGLFTPGPAADWLARHGMHRQMVPFSALNADPNAYPGQIIENELLAGKLDAAILWGPIAGYFAARAESANVVVVPLRSELGVQFEYAISAAVRFGDRESRAVLEDLITRTADDTAALLAEYHVPLLPATTAVASADDASTRADTRAASRQDATAREDAVRRAERDVAALDVAPGELVYVTNEDAGTISIISTATQTVIDEVQVGTRPRGVEVSPDGERVYVALSGSPKCPPTITDEECAKLTADKSKDGIGVIDARRRALIRVLPGGSDPEEFDVDAAGKRLFVSNEDADQLSIVDLETGEVVQVVDVGREPEGVRLGPGRNLVYVTSESDHAVTVVDAQSGKVQGTIKVGWRPRDSIFSADGARAYVSAEHGGSVAVIDVATSRVAETIALPAGSLPMGLALSPDGERLYVANGRAQTVSVIDLAASQVLDDVKVGARPWGVGLTSDGKYLYTANGPSNDVSVIDTDSLSVIATIRVGETPWGIAVGPAPQE